MIGLIWVIVVLSTSFYLLVVCPFVGHLFMNVLKLKSSFVFYTIKDYFNNHFITFWIGFDSGDYPNAAAGLFITMAFALIATPIILIILGI